MENPPASGNFIPAEHLFQAGNLLVTPHFSRVLRLVALFLQFVQHTERGAHRDEDVETLQVNDEVVLFGVVWLDLALIEMDAASRV